jgi:hypothetical protein
MLCWQVDNDDDDDDPQLLKLEVLAEVYPEDDIGANDCGDIKIVEHSLQRLYTLHFCSQLALYIPTLRAMNSMRSAICICIVAPNLHVTHVYRFGILHFNLITFSLLHYYF